MTLRTSASEHVHFGFTVSTVRGANLGKVLVGTVDNAMTFQTSPLTGVRALVVEIKPFAQLSHILEAKRLQAPAVRGDLPGGQVKYLASALEVFGLVESQRGENRRQLAVIYSQIRSSVSGLSNTSAAANLPFTAAITPRVS